VFTEVHFGNHFALEGASKKKSEICRWVAPAAWQEGMPPCKPSGSAPPPSAPSCQAGSRAQQLQTLPPVVGCPPPGRAIGAEVLVDDNPAYALECAQAGIQVLLYDWQHAYPWSKTADGPSHHRITR
jgi:hypothetical protein